MLIASMVCAMITPIKSATTANQPNLFSMAGVLEILKHLAGVQALSTEQQSQLDFRGDGKITMNTVLDVLKYLAGVTAKPEPPVPPPCECGCCDECGKCGCCDECGPCSICDPYVPPPLDPLCEELELRIRQDWVSHVERINGLLINIDDVQIHGYFGTYNGSVAVVMGLVFAIPPTLRMMKVGEFEFWMRSPAFIYIWNDGDFHILYSEERWSFIDDIWGVVEIFPGAYDLGLLTIEEVKEIHSRYHEWYGHLFSGFYNH